MKDIEAMSFGALVNAVIRLGLACLVAGVVVGAAAGVVGGCLSLAVLACTGQH